MVQEEQDDGKPYGTNAYWIYHVQTIQLGIWLRFSTYVLLYMHLWKES
jgi:hypothetical protein